jgi:hypothetical protein
MEAPINKIKRKETEALGFSFLQIKIFSEFRSNQLKSTTETTVQKYSVAPKPKVGGEKKGSSKKKI